MEPPLIFTPKAKELVFVKQRSALTNQWYLEVSFTTQLGELAVLTVEEIGEFVLGSLMLSHKLYGLNRIERKDSSSLESCALTSLSIAIKEFGDQLWPDKNTVKLYRALTAHSSEQRSLAPGILELKEANRTFNLHSFQGETSDGVELTLTVIDGYAIAQMTDEVSTHLVYEANLHKNSFSSLAERSRFIAKAYSDLVKVKV